jgi:uncharacterized protein
VSAPVEIATPVGPARVVVEGSGSAPGSLVLGHGAGGGTQAPDLLAARAAALALGLVVVRLEQPWRVRGRRVAEAAPRLDLAWQAVLAEVPLPGRLVVGGRSSGARVACRTATATGAAAVLALAFPLHPPGRPERSRLDELRAPTVPRLVVQGARDGFGIPAPEPGVEVRVVAGADHAFAVRRSDGRPRSEVLAEVEAAVRDWLEGVLIA